MLIEWESFERHECLAKASLLRPSRSRIVRIRCILFVCLWRRFHSDHIACYALVGRCCQCLIVQTIRILAIERAIVTVQTGCERRARIVAGGEEM